MHSSLASLALLANAVAALPQGWGTWGTLNIISVSKPTTTSTTTYTTEDTTLKTSQLWTSPSYSKTPVTSATTTTRTAEDPGWGNWQPSTLSTSSAVSKSPQVQSMSKLNSLTSSTYTTPSYSTAVASDWGNWNTTVSDQSSQTNSDHPGCSTSSSIPASHASGYSSIFPTQPPSTLASQPWSEWSQSTSTEALYTTPVPTATFIPVRPWNHDGQAPEHLQPDGQKQIYFASEGQGSIDSFHQFAALNLNFTSETVLLDHSDFLFHNYEDGSSSVLITFTTEDAFDVAQSSWVAGLILGVTDGECGSSGAGCFLMSTAITFDEASLSCMVSVTSLDFNEACHGFQIEWGHYTPSQTSGMTATADSSSSSFVNDANCAAPPDNIFGLPTACLGQNFDDDLDRSYGFERIEDSSFTDFITDYPNSVLDDSTSLDGENAQDGGTAGKRQVKRQSTVSPSSPSYRRPIQLFSTSFDYPQSPNLVDSPWGEQMLIKQFTAGNAPAGQGLPGNLAVYCVDCHISGSVDVTGSAQVSFFHGISDLGIRANANMDMSFNVGVDAQIQYQGGYQGTLFNVPLTPFTISTLVSVGPYMQVGVDLEFEANAQGQLLAGASLSWPNAFADISVMPKFGTSSGGFKPDFQPTLQANGSLDVSANFGLPIEIGVGFSALGFALKASIIESPSISGNATAAVVIDNVVQTLDGCDGILAAMSLHNELYAQVTGFKKVNILPSATWNIGPDCIGYTGQGSDSNGKGGDLTPNKTTSTATASTAITTSNASSTSTAGVTTATTTIVTNTVNSTDNTTTSTVISAPSSTTQWSGSNTISDSGSSTDDVCEPFSTFPCQASSSDSDDEVRDSTGEIPIVSTGGASDISSSEEPDANQSSASSSSSLSSSDTSSIDTSSSDVSSSDASSSDADSDTSSYSKVTLIDSSADRQAYPCLDGSVYVFDINDTISTSQYIDSWTMTQDEEVVIMDSLTRLPIYFPDEMSKTGVSRLRLVDVEEIPNGANEILLKTNSSDEVYHAENPAGEAFFPVVCYYSDGSLPKVFVVQDLTLGLVTLTLPTVKYSITGGDVSSCSAIQLTQGGGNASQSQSGSLDDSAGTGQWESVFADRR